MKYLPLVWANLKRKPLRLIFTLSSVLIAFLLFGYLAAIRAAFDSGVEVAGADRLIMIDKISLINLLPMAYEARIEAVDGVTEAVSATWFGGYYQEPKNFFAQFPTDPESYLRVYPEIAVSDDQRAAWLADRTGALIGRIVADRFGWKPGDRIPVTSPIWMNKDGSNTWEFNVSGIFDAGKKGFDTSNILFHHKYFEEARAQGSGMIGWYIISVENPDRATEIAARLDAMFANSPNETKTSTEATFLQGFADQVGDIGAIFTAIVAVVFFTLLLVAGNTMAQSVRERTGDFAIMNIFGFRRSRLAMLVVGESVVLALIGGLTGLGLAKLAVAVGGDPTGGFLPAFFIPDEALLTGVALVVLLGVIAGLLPAIQTLRQDNLEAIRKVI